MSVMLSLLIFLEFITIFAKPTDNNSPSDIATLIRTSDCGFSNKSFENELKLNELCHVGVLNAEEVKVKLVYDATPLLCPQIYEANLLICNLTKSSVNFKNILDRGVPNFLKDLRSKYKNVNDFCNSVNNMTFYFKSASDLNDINDYFQLILKNVTLCHKLCSRFDDSVADLCNVITWAHAFYGNETRSLSSVPVKEKPRSNIEYIRPKADAMREEHLKMIDNQQQVNPAIGDTVIKPEAAESNRSNTKSPTNVDNDLKTTKNVSKKVNQFTEEEVLVENNEKVTADNTVKNSKIQPDENQLTSPGKSVNTIAKNEEDLDIDQQPPPNEGRDNGQDNNNREDDDTNDDGTNKNVDIRNDALKTIESPADPVITKSGPAKVEDNDYSAGIPNPQEADDQQDVLSSSYGRQPVDTDINEVNPAVMNAAYRGGVDRLAGDEDSHFFTYCVSMGVVCGIMYVLFHNKKKILALAVEGRRGRSHSGSRRRPNTAAYSKLDSNLEEAMVSNVSQASVTHVLY